MRRKLPDTRKLSHDARRVGLSFAARGALLAVCSSPLSGACAVDDRTLHVHPGFSFLGDGQSGAGDSPGGGGTGDIEGDGGGQSDQPSTGGSGAAVAGGGDAGTDARGGTAGTVDGTAGAPGGGSIAGGSGLGGGSSGMGGALGRCPDLDGDAVGDCHETLIQNASFDHDTSGWSTETNVAILWLTDDGGGQPDSGSLGVADTYQEAADGNLMVGARQCQPVDGASVYRFIAQVSVPDEAPDTRGGFQLILFDGPKCTGNPLDSTTSNLTQGSAWQVADLTYLTPADAKSVVFRLVSVKPFAEPPVTVLFDNVLMHAD